MHAMLKWGAPGTMNREDEHLWLRYLDYYVKLHELNDAQMMRIFKTLDELNVWEDTIIIFTSDHGDQVGSHGLRSKGPWNYQETMRIPLYMKIPGKTKAGTKTHSLASHVDLAKTIAEFAGVTTSDYPGLVGESLSPIFDDLDTKIRDYVLFSQQWAWYKGVEHTRYASAGIFDGRYKYCRYYGVGGGADAAGVPLSGTIQFEFDSPFEDHDHELYDLQEDPHELINLAMDRSRRNELRTRFDELRAIEEVDYAPIPS
jgi:arylsulfatase A-like enzyme